jgi:hydrogenase nickel incorporation protein HypA/HybF
MHEFSMCEGIVENTLIEFEKFGNKNARLLKVKVVIGKLHRIVTDTLVFAFEVLTRETPIKGSVLELEQIAVTCMCNDCMCKSEITPPLFKCGKCSSGNLTIISGKELYIESLEVDVDSKPND